jgi:septal ring factor EnvC (AmiA/AmiB activator)
MHDHPQPAQPQQPERQASNQSMIAGLNQRLDQKMQELRVMENREVELAAVVADMEAELAGMRAALDQVVTENRVLRKRLELPESGAIELSDAEAEQLPPSAVMELD